MTGEMTKCNTVENQSIVNRYLSEHNPYESELSIGIDLVALERYAKENGKTAKELSPEEIAMFENQPSGKLERHIEE